MMTPQTLSPLGTLLSLRRVLSGGAPGQGRAADRRSITARFEQPDAIRAAMERAQSQGVLGMLTVGERRFFKALGGGPSPALPPVFPIVPNIQGFMREAVEHGIVGAGLVRVGRVGLAPLIGLGLRGVGRAPAILGRDFPTLLLCFIELELADFRRHNPAYVFLQAQVTDLALAMDNPRIIEAFTSAVRRLTGARAGYMTQNYATLAERFARWGIDVGPAVTPIGPGGGGMRPTRDDCEIAIGKADQPVWADRAGKPDSPSESVLQYFNRLGLAGAWRDDDQLLDLNSTPPPPRDALAMAGSA